MSRNFTTQTLDLLDTSGAVVSSGVPNTNYYSSTLSTKVLDNCIIDVKHNDDDAAATSASVRLEGSHDGETWIDLETYLDSGLVATISAAAVHGLLRLSDNPFPYLRVFFKSVTTPGDSVTITASCKEM